MRKAYLRMKLAIPTWSKCPEGKKVFNPINMWLRFEWKRRLRTFKTFSEFSSFQILCRHTNNLQTSQNVWTLAHQPLLIWAQPTELWKLENGKLHSKVHKQKNGRNNFLLWNKIESNWNFIFLKVTGRLRFCSLK